MADACLLAIEQHDFCDSIMNNRRPEIDGHDGATAVAALLGVYESERVRRPVSIAEVMRSEVDAYQRDTDRRLGLLPGGRVAT